jgi:hypothetical protein
MTISQSLSLSSGAVRILMLAIILCCSHVLSSRIAIAGSQTQIYIGSKQNHRCLDADLAKIGQNGTPIQLWDCWNGENQTWYYNADLTITNAQSGRCLDANLSFIGQKGTPIQLWDCWGPPSQKWRRLSIPIPFNSNSSDYFVNLENGRCLDANLDLIGQNGTPIQLWDCWGGQNQGWDIKFHFASSAQLFETGKCIDANLGFIGQDGTPIQLWDCWGGQNQAWFFNSDGSITNRQSGRCLDADLGTIGQKGTLVQLWKCSGGANQKWRVTDNGPWVNVQSGRCLDADLGTVQRNGGKIQLWDCWGNYNQRWSKAAYFDRPICSQNIPVNGLILQKYNSAPYTASVGVFYQLLDCPTEVEENADGNGRFQSFEGGKIGTTPGTGQNSVQTAYYDRYRDLVGFNWGPTDPFHYDFFAVRPSRDSAFLGQDEFHGSNLSFGSWSRVGAPAGTYRFLVEGCDSATFGGSSCNQGWTNPVDTNIQKVR